MSWNNEPLNKTDSTTTIPNNELSNTNSFRSVHSSSGVSSTGSFLFSADEEPSITTTTSSSIPAFLPSMINKNDDLTDELDEFDGKSSSSTVVGTDDHEHLPNTISLYEQSSSSLINSNDLINNDMIDHTNNRLSTASTNTLTPSSNNQSIIGMLKIIFIFKTINSFFFSSDRIYSTDKYSYIITRIIITSNTICKCKKT
jgi:hypothetical protein